MKRIKTTKTMLIKRIRKRAVIAATELLLILSGCGVQDSGAGKTLESASASTATPMEADSADSANKVPDAANNANKDSSAGHLQNQPDDTQEDIFNFKGVFLQILAENGEALSEEVKSEFLEMFGFQDDMPFYVHTGEDGYSIVELYYDEEREVGCGIVDGEETGNYSYGFAFNCCQEISWHYPDPFSVLSIYGTTGEEAVTDYRENYEYDGEGRPVHFQSTGTPLDSPLAEEDDEDWYDQYIIDVTFTYDDEGKLTKKVYKHSSAPYMAFGTWFSWQVSHYDERERLAHTDAYVTHGSVEGYYIYQDESNVPAYFLELDHGWDVNFYKFTEKEHNWEFGGYRSDPNAQFSTYEIEPGEEAAFLAEQGYSEENLFYEYEYEWTPYMMLRLSLYCDEKLTRGLGFIRWEYVDGEKAGELWDMEIFTFDGYEKYLEERVSPFSVYSTTYFEGRKTYFLHGETIEEYFRSLDLDGIYRVSFDHEDEKLTHMYQGLNHGSVDRFYIYRFGWGNTKTSMPHYMLELDHGWGVTFYRFD
ncbi:MAG: hypothetical protein J1E01_08055 [Acetatifactor sp.]|nr:hypothetical protein [Acetatifactor sp.]